MQGDISHIRAGNTIQRDDHLTKILSRLEISLPAHTAELKKIADRVNQPPVVTIEGDQIGSAFASALALNRGGARDAIEDIRQERVP